MFISCIGATRPEYSSGRAAGNSRVSLVTSAAFDTHAAALARRPRVPRGDLAERGGPRDLPPNGRALADRPDAELPRRDRARPGSRRRHEGTARRARPGRELPARGRGVPRPHGSPSLAQPVCEGDRVGAGRAAHAIADAEPDDRAAVRPRGMREHDRLVERRRGAWPAARRRGRDDEAVHGTAAERRARLEGELALDSPLGAAPVEMDLAANRDGRDARERDRRVALGAERDPARRPHLPGRLRDALAPGDRRAVESVARAWAAAGGEERGRRRRECSDSLDHDSPATGEWAILDSNQGPPPYQSGALTN